MLKAAKSIFSPPPADLTPDLPTNQSLADFRAKYDHDDGFSPAVNILSSESQPPILCARKFLRLRIALLLKLQDEINALEKAALSTVLKEEDKPKWSEIHAKLKEYDELFRSLQNTANLPDPETHAPLQLLHYVSTAQHALTAFRRPILPLAPQLGDGSEGYRDLHFFHQPSSLTPWEHIENWWLEYFTNTPREALHPSMRTKKKDGEGADRLANLLAGGVMLAAVAVGGVSGGWVEGWEEKVLLGAACVAAWMGCLVGGTDMKAAAVGAAGMGFALCVWIGVVLTTPMEGTCG